ncbi:MULTISPECIES: hypothetical protein [Bradyrhizobium]|uniref:Transposase n=2 Tax=Bradyrhizobium TaxID=374 RepID=A0ABY0QA89_9BRAD|nr:MULTISPECIES: hypothetical protein [Bradyrhizobium]SDJ78363.1 hypothetical protein SAMN05444163_6436 [Bradyrhizobium ottawaense]SEC12983.1 hypothetical protein SAMN05444171_0723 [Bradyrhizobium lablabi]
MQGLREHVNTQRAVTTGGGYLTRKAAVHRVGVRAAGDVLHAYAEKQSGKGWGEPRDRGPAAHAGHDGPALGAPAKTFHLSQKCLERVYYA